MEEPQEFTEKEKAILNHFFTNPDKPVFATRNFHPEVWALMQAKYSRSKLGMRDDFLRLLHENEENFNMLYESVSNEDRQTKEKHAIDKAIEFMEKWVLGYGHSSVAEGAVIGIGVEGISILGTKFLEDNRLASYIEKSTRYVSFGRDSFFTPKEIANSSFSKKYEDHVDYLFQTYMDFHKPVLEYVKEQVPLAEGQKEGAWKRSCAARRFDAIRYLLPTCTMTSLGWTINARGLAHAISKMASHPLSEFNDIAAQLKKECSITLPSLLKYADPNDYRIKTEKKMRALSSKLLPVQEHVNESYTKLVEAPKDVDEKIITAVLAKYSTAPYSQIRNLVEAMSADDREAVIDSYLEDMGEFDSPLRELEYAYFTWDIVMDYGAFRDLQRHRMCTQTQQLLTTHNGYETPPDIVGAGLRKEYDEAMRRSKELFEEMEPDMPYAAQYLVPMGFRYRFLFQGNLREMYTLVKLRTTPQGHYSYRTTCKEMYSVMKDQFPLATKYMQCHMSDDELGRLKQEMRLEEKIEKGLI